MAKKLQLSIPEPCHENWDVMTPVEKGRFCGSCQKQVVDFSSMSDRQVAEFFKKPSTGSVCGRFMTDQLERDIDIPKKRIPWFKYFFQIALPAFLVSMKASAKQTQGFVSTSYLKADTTKKPSKKTSPANIKEPKCASGFLVGDVDYIPPKKKSTEPVDTIRGTVIDDKEQPIPYATVMIKGSMEGTMSNAKGEFLIKPSTRRDKISLVSTCAGMETIELAIERDTLNRNVVIRMQPSLASFDVGVIVVTHKKKKKSSLPVIPDFPSTPSAFTVFPNPVDAGTNLNIEWKQKEEGYYNLQLLDVSGRSVYQQEIWIDADAKLLSIDVPQVTAGNYFVTLTNKKTKKIFTEKLLIR